MPDSIQIGDIGLGQAAPVPFCASLDRAARPVEAETSPTAKPWLCVHHNAARAAKVRLALRREGCEVHWPRFIERRENQDDVIRPLFRGYMFVQPPPNLGPALIRAIPNVVGVVGVRERGRADRCDRIVAHLLSRAGSLDGVIDETEDTLPITRFKRGDRVSVASGAFAGLHGLMKSDRGDARVRVLLSVLGGEHEVEMPREQVVHV